MFAPYFNHLPDELVKDILEDGFTKFNHDALSNFSTSWRTKTLYLNTAGSRKNLKTTQTAIPFACQKIVISFAKQELPFTTALQIMVKEFGKKNVRLFTPKKTVSTKSAQRFVERKSSRNGLTETKAPGKKKIQYWKYGMSGRTKADDYPCVCSVRAFNQ